MHGSGRPGGGASGKPKAPPPPFLVKLLQMLSAPDCEAYVRWSEDGAYIVLRQVEELGSEVLPRFFRHNKFSSFLRQVRLRALHLAAVFQFPPPSPPCSAAHLRLSQGEAQPAQPCGPGCSGHRRHGFRQPAVRARH